MLIICIRFIKLYVLVTYYTTDIDDKGVIYDTETSNDDNDNDNTFIGGGMSGADFKRAYPDCSFVKLTNETENHHGFQFSFGNNVDVRPFGPYGSCNVGGIYFIEDNKAYEWIDYSNDVGPMRYMRSVYITDDAQVWVFRDSFKADKIVLGPRTEISRDIYMKRVEILGLLTGIPETMKDKQMCMRAIKQNGCALQHVPESMKDKRLCLEAVKQNGNAIRFVPTAIKDKEIYLEAVKQNGYVLQFIPDDVKDIDICSEAVKKDGLVLQYVPYPLRLLRICEKAVRHDVRALQYVPQNMRNSMKYQCM